MSKKRRQVQTPVAATPPPPTRRSAMLGWLAEALAGLAARPVLGLFAGFLLMFGGIFLAMAWACGPEPLIDSYRYAPYTAHTAGRIVESWAAIEFDPADVPDGKLYWQPVSRISPCAVVEYEGDWGGPLRRTFCGNRFDFSDSFRLDDWHSLAPGVPFAFLRDASGFAVEEVRIARPALEWIRTHPPQSTFLSSTPPPTTALGALQAQFDRPLDVAVASWSTPLTPFALAYDPRHPEAAMPAALVAQRQRGFRWGSLAFALVFAVPGVLVWRTGIGVLTGQSGALLWLLAVLPLLALPWWSDALPAILQHADRDWADVTRLMLEDITRVTRFSASSRDDALLAGGERLTWHVESGAYADTFGRMRFHLPQPAPASAAAALAELRAQAKAQVLQLDSRERAALFTRLRRQYESFARRVQDVFTSAALATVVDAAADRAARRAAKDFLLMGSGETYYEDQLDALERSAGDSKATSDTP